MHKNYTEAIEYVEKAYLLLPKKKNPNFMFVLLQMILVYQHEEQYEKVEKICREALSIKEGYLDVYYYYAESQAVLKNNQEAIEYYEKYLDLLAKRDQLVEKDLSIIEYSLGFQQLVYSNLLRICKQEKNYEKALFYAEQITDAQFIESNILNIIYLYITLEKYSGLRTYYDNKITDEYRTAFFNEMVKCLEQFGQKEQRKIAEKFQDVQYDYGLLCKLILEHHDGCFSERTREAITKISLENLPVYCSDILYYLLKTHYPLENFILNFKEIWLTCAFETISKNHDDLCEVIYNYLQKFSCNSSIHEYKLGKTLARSAILLGRLNEEQYRETFDRYLQEGICYLQMVYNPIVIDNTLVYEVKNDEEVFLLYIDKAKSLSNQQSEYLKNLRCALQAFPGMKRGIEMLLKEIQDTTMGQHSEFEAYKQQVKSKIAQYIEDGKISEAKVILDEYKTLVPSDVESILLESRILLN